jgi:hypothetical protein
MPESTTVVSIPTEDEYRAAMDALSRGIDPVEQLATRLDRLADGWDDVDSHVHFEPEPTFADIGALWSMMDDANDQVENLAHQIGRLKKALVLMDGARQTVVLSFDADQAAGLT